jgi:predicted enzyme related to lactoylglutathione lyase
MLEFNTVMIGTDDPKALKEFYTGVLGKPAWEDNAFVGWQAGNGMLMIGEHSEVKGRNEMPGRIILNFQTSDVKGEFDRIKGLGATVAHEPYQPGGAPEMWLATFEDPDGNYFQLASPMPAQ